MPITVTDSPPLTPGDAGDISPIIWSTSEFMSDAEQASLRKNLARAGLLVGAGMLVGYGGLIARVAPVAEATTSVGSWLRALLWPATIGGGGVGYVLIGDALFYLGGFNAIIAQLEQWILDPLNPKITPIPGWEITPSQDGGVVIRVPRMWRVDP